MEMFCNPDCEHLDPKEEEQTKSKEPHFCRKYDRQLLHGPFHPRLICVAECRREQLPNKGDYVLATKFVDGLITDGWGLGFFDREEGGKFFLTDYGGRQLDPSGFARVKKIGKEQGHFIWKNLKYLADGTTSIWSTFPEDEYNASNEN